MSFWIEKISALGDKKKPSTIRLKGGTNIIFGPSNTGKTCIAKCIEYMFGETKKEPFLPTTGYDCVQMVVHSSNETYTMTRKLGESTIRVDQTGTKNETAIYRVKTSRKNYDSTINSFWLSLMGIDEMHTIISSENFKKSILSWKNIYHLFVLSETRVISENSILLSEQLFNNTAILSSLGYLLLGQDFSDADTRESKEVREAKKKALKTYIDAEVENLNRQSQEIESAQSDFQNIDVDVLIQETLDEISDCERKLTEAASRSQSLLESIQEKNQDLSECNMLLFKYDELMSQYEADLKRLSFIVDGELNSKTTYSTHCPICETAVTFNRGSRYIEAAQAEYKKIRLQASDLVKASKDLTEEKASLEATIEHLQAEKKDIDELVTIQLAPKLTELREKSLEYKKYIANQATLKFIKSIMEQKSEDRLAVDIDTETNIKFHPKEHLGEDFYCELGKSIKNLLEQCHFGGIVSVVFDKEDMDVVINGKKKNANGKGYSAFLNAVVAISLSRYMDEYAKYSPHFLLIDSPILSLKEPEEIKPTDTMSTALFKNIVSMPLAGQTIIIENEIPSIDYSNANLIEFTKQSDSGRYGFLEDITE